jgi:hypothetical protein
LWWRDVHVDSSTELPDARVGGLLFHDQIPQCFASLRTRRWQNGTREAPPLQ